MRVIGLLVLLGLAVPPVCRGAAPECSLWLTGSRVQVQLDHPELFAGALENLLDSGFELRLSQQLELLDGAGRPLAAGTTSVRAVHDLWTESYVVETGSERLVLSARAEALERLRRAVTTVPFEASMRGGVLVRVRARLAPVSAEPAEQSKEWLEAPAPPGAAEDAAGGNLFTAFAHLLVTPDLEQADEASYVLGPLVPRAGPEPQRPIPPASEP